MPGPGASPRHAINREVAFAGQRITQKVALGLALAVVIPLLVLTFSFYAFVLPAMPKAGARADLLSIASLLAFTGLAMLGGGIVLWDVAVAVSRAARMIASSRLEPTAPAARSDEIGELLASFARMTVTIEHQAEELRRVPARLDELAHQALRDPLTGLPTRALFLDRLGHGLGRTERRSDDLAVLFLDLDRFKLVNESLGHAAGDRLLAEVGHRLESAVRPGDTVARLGGDEFGVLLEGVANRADVTRVAERIAALFEPPFRVDGREVFVTASVGIALSPSPETLPELLLHRADLAHSQAKARGKGQYAVYEDGANAPAVERLDLEMDLRGAVPRNEFVLHYQPLIDLATGAVVGLEALIRWAHPTRGLLPPGDFITLTEETGLIQPIGHWVLGEACDQMRRWHRAADGFPSTIAVNLSAKQVQHPGLVNELMDVLLASGLPPSSLMLEITESVMMDGEPETLATLRALRALGIRLALDDFGTGYSALNYLNRFPLDTLKIDRSLVQGLGHRPEDTAVVQAVITVAKNLHLRVTAEGIETEEQAAQLRSLGCDYGQGFLFARPLPAEKVPALLARPRWTGRAAGPERAASQLRPV